MTRDEQQTELRQRESAEVDNVRQRQQIDQLTTQLAEFETKTKAILYERTTELTMKDQEILRLKE